MDTIPTMEERLWDYIDGFNDPAEKSLVEGLIAANAAWQQKYRELLEVHQLMNSTDLDAPSLRFTKNVMEEITRHHVAPATKTYINKNIIRSVGAFFLVMIAGFLAYCLSQFKWSFHNSSGPSNSFHINVEAVNWSRIFSGPYTTIFMLITVILGLMLLDMYLQRRHKLSKEA